MKKLQQKRIKQLRRARRVRAKIRGTAGVPRFSVFRSSRHFFAQLIDDTSGRTLVSASDLKDGARGKDKKGKSLSALERARQVGGNLAEKAKAQRIIHVRFDRGQYSYHGLVAALAEGAKKGGLKF